MNTIRIYLITQPYLTIEKEKGGINKVAIQRISEREWLPLFYVNSGAGEEVVCSLRAMDRDGVRVWDSLNLMCEWIRETFEIYFCEISLTNVEIEYKGENTDE